MDNRIVLGFPYAGAFLWLLSAEEHYNKAISEKYDGRHPYYKTLFGKKHNSIINETVSLTLLFDEIYLSPTDTFLPDRQKYHNDQNYHNTELGIITNWDWQVSDWDTQVDVLLQDNEVNEILKKVPKDSRQQILWETINQVHISNKFDTAIFAIPSYLRLCERVNKIINLKETSLKTISSITPLNAVNTVFDISSIQFSIQNLEEFAFLKQAKAIKEYSQSFRKYVKELPNGDLNDLDLLEAMMEAINKDEIASKISGSFGMTSTFTSLISLIPGVGTVGGLVGLVADGTSRTANAYANNNKWWLLAPEISKQLTKKRIESLYKQKKGNR